MRVKFIKSLIAISIVLTMLVTGTLTAYAGTKSSGVKAEYDEAYYVTTDYYGNITDGSIVKSYTMNGQKKIIDHGKYDEVNNLSDERKPVMTADRTEFSFDEGEVPKNFYYECKTKEPYSRLPWDISVTYKLNGTVTPAENLAGEKGIIEIDIDIVPNKDASEYSRYNYTVETTALFNDDSITSLEAEGAQVQLVGNIRVALFVGLPGEEQHLNIKVGSDDFEFGGLTFLMVPATLGQLTEISRLADNIEEIEKHYRKLSKHLNRTIDSFDSMEENLSRTASDLKKVADDTRHMAGTAAAIPEEMTDAKHMVSKSMDVMDPMMRDMVSLKIDLRELGNVIDYLQGDLGDAEDKLSYLTEIRNDLEDTADTLEGIEDIEVGIHDMETTSQTAYQLYGAYLVKKAEAESQGASLTFGDFLYGYGYQQALPQVEAGVKQMYISQLMEQGYSKQDAEKEITVEPLKSQVAATIQTMTDARAKEVVQEYQPQEEKISHLYKLYSSNQASPADASYDSLFLINDMVVDLDESLEGSLKAPEDLIRKTRSLIGSVKDYRQLIRDMNALGTVTQTAVVEKGQIILNEIEALNQLIDDYRPSAGTLAQDMIDTAVVLNQTTVDTAVLLDGIGDALQDAADGMDNDGDLRETKDDICETIEDIWHDYTGEKNNLLFMDADAAPVSISGEQNDSPRSIQVVIRSQEIKKAEKIEDAVAVLNKAAGNTGAKLTLGERISKMFNDLFTAVKKLFVREVG